MFVKRHSTDLDYSSNWSGAIFLRFKILRQRKTLILMI